MGSSLLLIYVFLQKYLVPLIFAIGLMYLIYGCIEYYFAGRKGGDEGRAQNGRLYLLRALSWFVIAVIAFGIVAAIGWLGSLSFSPPNTDGSVSDGNFGIDLNREENRLGVPNVPRSNDE